MSKRYILAIDQSTQGTKGILFDQQGVFVARTDRSHRQFVDEKGWVEHDPEEILTNTLAVARDVVQKAGIGKEEIAALGISNQRETVMAWDRSTGKPLYRAIVWQCARAKEICEGMQDQKDLVKSRTGLNLSPLPSWPGSCRMCRKQAVRLTKAVYAAGRWIAGWFTS